MCWSNIIPVFALNTMDIIVTIVDSATQHQIYVIRAPRIFPAMFKLVKPFFAQETKDKVFVLSDSEVFAVRRVGCLPLTLLVDAGENNA